MWGGRGRLRVMASGNGKRKELQVGTRTWMWKSWVPEEKGDRRGRMWKKRRGLFLYLDPMANVIQAAKIEGFPVVRCERG